MRKVAQPLHVVKDRVSFPSILSPPLASMGPKVLLRGNIWNVVRSWCILSAFCTNLSTSALQFRRTKSSSPRALTGALPWARWGLPSPRPPRMSRNYNATSDIKHTVSISTTVVTFSTDTTVQEKKQCHSIQ